MFLLKNPKKLSKTLEKKLKFLINLSILGFKITLKALVSQQYLNPTVQNAKFMKQNQVFFKRLKKLHPNNYWVVIWMNGNYFRCSPKFCY